MRYKDLSRKRKQLIAAEYPYKSDEQLFNSRNANVNSAFSSRSELMEFKEEAAKDDVALQKRRNFVTSQDEEGNTQNISILDTVCSPMGEEAYRDAVELAQYELDPTTAIKEMYILQAQRVAQGRQYEIDTDLGLSQETEAAIGNMINLIRLDNDIKNGQKLDVQLDGSLSSMIMGMNLDDELDDEEDYIDTDIVEEEEDDNDE